MGTGQQHPGCWLDVVFCCGTGAAPAPLALGFTGRRRAPATSTIVAETLLLEERGNGAVQLTMVPRWECTL
jgi:hypothetical protein